MPINESMHFSVCLYVCLCFGGLYFTHYNLHEMHFYVFAYHWNTAFVCFDFVFCISLIICNLIHFYFLWISAGVLCLCLLLWKTRFLSNPDPLFKFKTYPWDVLNILSIILIRIVLIDFWFAIFILINCT